VRPEGRDEHALGELVESQLEISLAKADRARREVEGDRPAEASYLESCRKQNEKTRLAALWEQYRYHTRMLASHTETFRRVAGHHEGVIARLEIELGIDDEGDAA